MRIHAAVLATVLAAAARGDDGGRHSEVPVLVELFTSEGCSSCPPADAALARLLARPPEGVQVVALGEHVDYWDTLGWKDRFSAGEFTRRQEAYVRRLRLTAPYTPQLVVNGRADVLGGDEPAARRAISAAASVPDGMAHVRVVSADPTQLTVEVRAQWASGVTAEVTVALVQDRARSRVEAGENAGRVLDHVAVVRSIRSAGRGEGVFRGTVRVPLAGARGADRVVVVVQEPGLGPVRAAASEPLTPQLTATRSSSAAFGGRRPSDLPAK